MCIMSMCDHNIIVNSSFSGQHTYINKSQNKEIICPYNYLNDSSLNELINGKYF